MQSFHHFSDLFDQLGLPSDDQAVKDFICAHRPLPAGMALADAPFWNASQADFLRQQVCMDADWAQKIEGLNAALHDAVPY